MVDCTDDVMIQQQTKESNKVRHFGRSYDELNAL